MEKEEASKWASEWKNQKQRKHMNTMLDHSGCKRVHAAHAWMIHLFHTHNRFFHKRTAMRFRLDELSDDFSMKNNNKNDQHEM